MLTLASSPAPENQAAWTAARSRVPARERLLIVEDDPLSQKILKARFESENFEVVQAYDGETGVQKALESPPALILLDLFLPALDGYEVCRRLRSETRMSSVPIFFLTQRNHRLDILMGFRSGADDYLGKPFDLEILVAKVRARVRREPERGEEAVQMSLRRGPLYLDRVRGEARVSGRLVDLTAREFQILWALARREGVIHSRGQLLGGIAGGDLESSDRSIDVHITSIRKKLACTPDLVRTVRGQGYCLSLAEL